MAVAGESALFRRETLAGLSGSLRVIAFLNRALEQAVKVKLAAYPFQKYGMVEGRVAQVSADATEAPSANTRSDALTGRDRPMGPLSFRALVDLKGQVLEAEGVGYKLARGMQVVAEINLGRRTVMEYLLSPVQRVGHEAGRGR